MVDARRTWLTARPSRWSLLVPVVAIAAGSLFSASSLAANGTDLRPSANNLPDLIRQQTRANSSRAAQLGSLQKQVDGLEAQSAPGDAAVAKLRKAGDALAMTAGQTAVEGPVVSVSLTDSTLRGDQIPAGMTVDDIVVHQQDVQGVVNALWAGGAEAMMLMDQRVISTSAVRCVGNTLILQGRVYSPPFVVKAMGDPAKLRSALDRSPQIEIYKEYVARVGLGYDLRTIPNATFPAYAGLVNLDHSSVTRP